MSSSEDLVVDVDCTLLVSYSEWWHNSAGYTYRGVPVMWITSQSIEFQSLFTILFSFEIVSFGFEEDA